MVKRFCLVLGVLLWATPPLWAQRMTEEEERARFQKLLEYARTADPPSRHTAHEEMVQFREWVEPELLGRLANATIRERQLFWWVLYDRRCRAAMAPAFKMLPDAIERCRQSQLAVHEIHELHMQMKKAERAGDADRVKELTQQIQMRRRNVQWNEITQGDEVAVLCAIITQFGRERELRKFVELAISSSKDDALAKGITSEYMRTHRDEPIPGGTEMWNAVYGPVWHGLLKLSQRALKESALVWARKKLAAHFEKLKGRPLNPNQEACLKLYSRAERALLKTEKHTTEPDEDEKDENEDPDVEIIRM